MNYLADINFAWYNTDDIPEIIWEFIDVLADEIQKNKEQWKKEVKMKSVIIKLERKYKDKNIKDFFEKLLREVRIYYTIDKVGIWRYIDIYTFIINMLFTIKS